METKDENNLQKYFDSIKEENYKDSFNKVENWLRRESTYSFAKPEKSKFKILKYIFSEGKLKFAYLFIILILVGITSNFSVTRTEPVGVVMSWSVDKQNPEAIKKIDNLDWIDKSKLVVNEETSEGKQVLVYKVLIPTSNQEEIEKLKNELSSLKDIYSVNVIPISEPVKQPLYAVALGKVFDVGYDKNLANPDEIKNNVFEQLKLAGIQNDVNLNVVPISSAGKYVDFDFGKKPDSIRIKLHCDVVNEYNLERALKDVDMLLAPVRVLTDSILKTIVVDINGESMIPEIVIANVQRNLDTLHFKLERSEEKRRERMEKFNEKMERFHERMERFNKGMEKLNRKIEKFNDKAEDLNIDIQIPELPEIDVDNFDINIDLDDLNSELNFKIDTTNFFKFRFDLEKNQEEVKENMSKFKEDMKKFKEDMHKYKDDMYNYKNDMRKYKEDMKKNKSKWRIDTTKVRIYQEEDENEEDEYEEFKELELNDDY